MTWMCFKIHCNFHEVSLKKTIKDLGVWKLSKWLNFLLQWFFYVVMILRELSFKNQQEILMYISSSRNLTKSVDRIYSMFNCIKANTNLKRTPLVSQISKFLKSKHTLPWTLVDYVFRQYSLKLMRIPTHQISKHIHF